MPKENNGEYLIGKDIVGLKADNCIFPLTQTQMSMLGNLSKKERALRYNGFLVLNDKGETIFEDRKRYSQHFFPLSVIDYVKVLYNFERFNKPVPILSVDSHDVLACDFRCQDCLSAHGTNFPVSKFPKNNFNMDIETYKKILMEIHDYSKRRGFKGVRFEQSGEGNPDYYAFREEILRYAKELEMQSVYVSTGSKIKERLMSALAENASFVRISFPGIGIEAYNHYSGQNKFSFLDALHKLRMIVRERKKRGKIKELMIGARVALRLEHNDSYYNFARMLKDIGIDTLQVVKILVPEGKRPSDFLLSPEDVEDLQKAKSLEDSTFNVSIPHGLDYMVYSREIENRSEFPIQCFSARFQPVLAGRSIFVCTISDKMYSQHLKLGTFSGKAGELEEILSEDNLGRVARDIPSGCKSCSNIYDNILLFSLQRLFRTETGKLNFYEIIK